ncbi:MAG TPA: lysophospholipid acyltransferase family protein [Verrucomicrobiae bacterium]|nr:lysophospholipid acyltransferase family protein [Verrucomicrobiae bacterium]
MKIPGLYLLMRGVVGIALGFYFRRIERFHPERVPLHGPVLFTCNHPNSLTDSFLVGDAVPRKVNFVATVQLFQFKPLKWLLTNCGVIPINRVKDDPRAMRTVADTFEACYRVLERGEAIGIFPEGITHDDPQLKTVKTGAARMALELEHRHGGKLGLQIVTVGLTLSAKEKYRSEALVNFGEPIRAADFLLGYPERKKECINQLNEAIEQSIQSLILHIPQIEHARIVEAVKRLYLERLRDEDRALSGPMLPGAEELTLTQRIVRAVERVYQTDPERAANFVHKLDLYEKWRARFNLSDESLASTPQKRRLARQAFVWAMMAILGAPIALYGWAHRLLPFCVVAWSVKKFAHVDKHKAQTSTAAIIAGVVSFTFFYALYAWVFHLFFDWHTTIWYILTLPLAGIISHYYVRELRRLSAGWHDTLILLRTPAAARRLVALRAELIAEIEAAAANLRQSRTETDQTTVTRAS